MNARDVMTSNVVTVTPGTTVREAAARLIEHRISAAPVVNEAGKLVGIVSEGDLLHRVEIGTERRRSWWLQLLASERLLAAEYVKSHGSKVEEVMTRTVVTADPETPLQEVAMLMERNAIKRVPIVKDGKLLGIVSRANLVQAIATQGIEQESARSDELIREELMKHLSTQPWAHTALLNATVSRGVVSLWGFCSSTTEREAVRVAAERIPGVKAVEDHIQVSPIAAATA
ncbi:CBS domain-containing protein [Enterovirga sp. CN4-39]|uniref:CBS domain-containing protein n=1 Tax=Enterovirga sp. CN4-39 TaxID=3400910 RepID=UPI003C02FD12